MGVALQHSRQVDDVHPVGELVRLLSKLEQLPGTLHEDEAVLVEV